MNVQYSMKNGLAFSILVVDDDEDDRILIDEAFMEIGHDAEVKKFIDAKAMFKYLSDIDTSLLPSLIVLDNTLPGIDTEHVVSLLKESDTYKNIPIVIYTTAISKASKAHLLSLGVYACYEKGSTMEEIVGLVKELRQISEKKLSDT